MAERTSPATLRSQPDYDASPTYLTSALPPRAGQRPRTESCLPHAQMEAESPDDIFEALTAAASASLGDGVVQGPTTVSVPSTWPAYHLCRPCGAAMPPEACMTPGGPACGLEFAHVHARYIPSDHPTAVQAKARGLQWQEYQGGGQGSMHMCLSLRDAAAVLDAGWGELHLLAGRTMGPGAKVPRGLVLVYAPRTAEEVSTVVRILGASHAFARSAS